MALKLWPYNYVDRPQTVITASSENAQFPVSNLKNPIRSKVFRSVASSCTVVFDLVTASEIDSILLAPHPRDGWGITTPVTIEANPTNVWTSPAFSTTLVSGDMDQEFEVAIKEFTAQTYRFWRLSFSGVSCVEIPYVFIGKRVLVGEAGLGTGRGRTMNYGWEHAGEDLSVVTENDYGQRFVDERVVRRRWAFTMGLLNKDEYDDLFEAVDYCKKSRPFFIHVDAPILNNTRRLAGVYQFDVLPPKSNPTHGLYDANFVISEVM